VFSTALPAHSATHFDLHVHTSSATQHQQQQQQQLMMSGSAIHPCSILKRPNGHKGDSLGKDGQQAEHTMRILRTKAATQGCCCVTEHTRLLLCCRARLHSAAAAPSKACTMRRGLCFCSPASSKPRPSKISCPHILVLHDPNPASA